MRTNDIRDMIIDILHQYNKCLNLNINIRFYINDKLFMAYYSKSQIMIFAEEAFALINETKREEMINKTKHLAKGIKFCF